MSASLSTNSAFRPRNLLGILSFLKRYPWQTAVVIGLLLVNLCFEMTLPRISGTAINQLREAVATGQPFEPWFLAGCFIGVALLRAAGGFVLGRLRNRLIQGTLRDIRSAYFDAVQRLSFAYHDRSNTGELISRGTSDITRLQDFLFACLFMAIDISAAMLLTLGLIFWIYPWAGLATLLTLAPSVGLLIYYARRLHPQWRRVHDLRGQMTTVIQENIAGVRVVKAFAREGDEIRKFSGQRDAFMSMLMRTVRYWTMRVPVAQFVFGLSMPLVLWLGGREVIAGRLPVGHLAMMVFYLMGLGNRMSAIGQLANIVQNAAASAERVTEVLREPPALRGGTRRFDRAREAEVGFEHVSFRYGGDLAALEDISFTARAGQTVAVVGATGSGKSTLVHLIPRFYDPIVGTVRINGTDVREFELGELRRSVGMIFQETVLFSASVSENIAYGRPEATRERIEAAARAAHAHEFIVGLENGYETAVGERGVSLSGGQKQRLAIARAFLLDPQLLILDDATSSLDAKTERLIQEDMRRICLGRTAFVIAHRLTTVQHADWVIVLKEGRLVEQGSPVDLQARGGHFSELFRAQREERA